MTNATHTPGPWTAEYSDYGDEIWFGGYGAGMWTVEPVGAYLDGASQANARLIAAAPELLAALVDAQAMLCELEAPAHLPEAAELDERIAALIVRVEGE